MESISKVFWFVKQFHSWLKESPRVKSLDAKVGRKKKTLFLFLVLFSSICGKDRNIRLGARKIWPRQPCRQERATKSKGLDSLCLGLAMLWHLGNIYWAFAEHLRLGIIYWVFTEHLHIMGSFAADNYKITLVLTHKEQCKHFEKWKVKILAMRSKVDEISYMILRFKIIILSEIMEEMKSDLMFHCKSLHHRGNFESADIYGDFLGTRWRQLSVHRADLQTVNVELYQ